MGIFFPTKNSRRHPSLDFSIAGLVYCAMMMFMGLAAMNTQANLLFGLFGLMIGVLVISGSISRTVLRKLRVHRNLPKHGVVGQRLVVYYEITNGKRLWPSLSVTVSELDNQGAFVAPLQCYLLHAAPRLTATVPIEFIPRHRGIHELDHYQLSTSFPFGFIKRAIVHQEKDSICVFPALAEVDQRLILMCRAADDIGQASRPKPGGMEEFYGLREYRRGDNPRQIYWRRSARTGVLVARDMTHATPPRLMLLVDTFSSDTSADSTRLIERTIAMAASMASAALNQEIAVGMSAWSEKPMSMQPLRGKQHREEMLTALACLVPNRSFPIADLLDKAIWMARTGATLVLLTPRGVDLRLPEAIRSQILIVSAESETTSRLFRFSKDVEF